VQFLLKLIHSVGVRDTNTWQPPDNEGSSGIGMRGIPVSQNTAVLRVTVLYRLVFFRHHSTLSRPLLKMQQDIRTLKRKCNAAMIALCRRQVW